MCGEGEVAMLLRRQRERRNLVASAERREMREDGNSVNLSRQ
jgi:hypothetical protein